ncbi:hypothetical protein DEO72_LG1g2844 [Vigna unguiculata]|uniref:Uncharacterized protein n=1 Tax=Vigna unguiculata TaxID=3917 RepID=A0A4D6KRP6_VIGUN|nr:hypothetical protein DEO72_LG1g2844 [Vigna unguiculata]
MCNPPGDRVSAERTGSSWRLAARVNPPGDKDINNGFLERWRLTVRAVCLAVATVFESS